MELPRCIFAQLLLSENGGVLSCKDMHASAVRNPLGGPVSWNRIATTIPFPFWAGHEAHTAAVSFANMPPLVMFVRYAKLFDRIYAVYVIP
jgi:hypothetical protein